MLQLIQSNNNNFRKHNERAYLGEQKERIQHEDNRANFDRCPAQVELPPIRITEFFAIVQHVRYFIISGTGVLFICHLTLCHGC